ncbi:MAG: tetratricopeptide repeat protein [Candidatus Latescibacterota bacterium]|nr:tetratricopeptide repeat protein [Candidatus Latescibacterota bacterium]
MTIWIGLIALGLGVGTSFFLPVPQTLRTSFDAGQSLYALGEYQGAIEEYNKIVKFKNKAVRTDSVRVTFGQDLDLPVVAAAWYQLGNSYKRSGDHEDAVDAFHRVIDMASVSVAFRSTVQFQVAETRFLQKQYEEAAKEYKTFVSKFPDHDWAGEAYYKAGESEFNTKSYAQAIGTLQGMLDTYPENAYAGESQYKIANSHFEMGAYETAIAHAEVVLERYPNNPVIAQATYLTAQAYDKMGEDEDSIRRYREVRDLYDRMFELLRGSFREQKNVDFERYRDLFESSSLRVAEIFRQQGNFQDAYQELIAAQETAEERFYKAKVQMRLGDNYMAWKRFDDAYTAFNQVIALYSDTPYPPNAQYQKGEARYFSGDFVAARDEYVAVSAKYPDSNTELRAAALYSAGYSAERMDDPDGSLKLYAQVVEAFPRSDQAPLCLLRMGRVNTEQQRFGDAVVAYETIANSYGETKHAADANYGVGLLYKQQGRLDDAVAAFSNVGRDARDVYVVSLVEAANIHIGAGKGEQGRQLLDELLEGVSGDRDLEAQAHYQIAQLDLNNDNYTDAINRYTLVIDTYAESGVIRDSRYGRALAFHKANRFNRALTDYQWLLDVKLPDSMRLKVEFAMALSHAASGNDAEATRLLTAVIDSGDETLARNAQLQLISMAEKQDPEVAIQTYEGMLAQLQTEADRVRVLIRLASAYFRLGQYDQSIQASQQLLDIAIESEDIANGLFVQGNSHFRAGNLPVAIETYQRIVDNYPQIGWARNAQFQIAAAYNKMSSGNVEYVMRMADAFETYYTTYPEDDKAVLAYYYAAYAYYRLGKWRTASEVFEALVNKYPRSTQAPQALFRSGEAIFNMAQGATHESKQQIFQEALTKYNQVLDRYPNSDFADDALYNKAWAFIHLSEMGTEGMDKEDALPLFGRIVEEFPDGRYGARSLFTLGDYYYGEKDYVQATASYQHFLDIYTEERLKTSQDKQLRRKATVLLGHLSEIEAYNVYASGEALFDEQQYEEAVEIFRDVIERFPTSDQAVNASVNIAAAYMARENYRKAGEEFQKVVETYGGNPRFVPQVDFSRQQLEALEEARVL